jgi:hypothetical protein
MSALFLMSLGEARVKMKEGQGEGMKGGVGCRLLESAPSAFEMRTAN